MKLRRLFTLSCVLVALLASFGVGAAAAQAQESTCSGKAAAAAGLTAHTIQSGGVSRDYLLYVPESYDPAQALPLVLSLHGFGGNPREQARDSGWDDIADREGIIVAYPAGTGSPARWNAGQREIPGMQTTRRDGPLAQFLGGFFERVQSDDVSFIRDLVTQVESDLCIDSARVYVNGMSNGGGMTNRLACEASDVFAAAGMVAGAYTDFGGCNPPRPVPVVAFHGVTDPIVPYEGDERIHFPAIEDWVADWAQRDQCSLTPEAIPGTVGAVTGTRYVDCADDAEVDFYSIADGGHTWPGGSMGLAFLLGKTTQDIDASETMWAFFAAHPMP